MVSSAGSSRLVPCEEPAVAEAVRREPVPFFFLKFMKLQFRSVPKLKKDSSLTSYFISNTGKNKRVRCNNVLIHFCENLQEKNKFHSKKNDAYITINFSSIKISKMFFQFFSN